MITWHTEKRKLSDLIEWGRNPRQLSKHDAEHIQRSLEKFGVADPLVVNTDNLIIGGHQRKRILQMIAEADPNYEVDVRIPDRTLTDEEVAELNIRLNKNSGSWDWDVLANEFEAMELLDWGFTEEELTGLDFGYQEEVEDAEPQIDKAEELREKWGVKTGQLWKLGEHRLICGDCTDKAIVDRVIGEYITSITFTSPPYNAGVSAKLRGNTNIGDNLYKDEYFDNKSQSEYLDLLSKFTDISLSVSQYVFVNIQVLAGNKKAFAEYLYKYVDKFCDVAIWDKRHAAPAAAQRVMDSRFEFILVFGGNGSRAIGTREFRGMVHNVYESEPQRHNENASIHAATFPVEFPEYFIKTFTNQGELVFEPFCGTGTTIIACEKLGRKCRAIEISPAYCAVSIQRWVDATGGEPELIDG